MNRDRSHHDSSSDHAASRPAGSTILLPLIAAVSSILALLLLLSVWSGTPLLLGSGFSLLKFAAYCGFGCAVISLVSGITAWNRRHRVALLISLIALVAALLALWFAVLLDTKGEPPSSSAPPTRLVQ